MPCPKSVQNIFTLCSARLISTSKQFCLLPISLSWARLRACLFYLKSLKTVPKPLIFPSHLHARVFLSQLFKDYLHFPSMPVCRAIKGYPLFLIFPLSLTPLPTPQAANAPIWDPLMKRSFLLVTYVFELRFLRTRLTHFCPRIS